MGTELNEKVILIPITNQAFALNQIGWANMIEDASDWIPIVYWVHNNNRIEEIIRDRNARRPVRLIKNAAPYGLPLRAASFAIRIARRFRIGGFGLLIPQTLFELLSSRRAMKDFRDVLKRHAASVALIPDSSPAYFAPELVSVARRMNIPVMTNPLDRDCPESYAMIYRTDSSLYPRGWTGKIISRRFPEWMVAYERTRLFRLPPAQILAQKLLKISPSHPWNTFGFMEDRIVVNNRIQFHFFTATGVPASKISLVGSPQLDLLYYLMSRYEEHKAHILSELSFAEERPLILCALVQTHWVAGRPEAEFQDHKEMVDVWIATLTSQRKYNVIISLHPSMRYDDYKYLDSPSLKVAQIGIVELLPVCSIFVSCISSVIQYAIALGKPVINYDVYRYSTEMKYLAFSQSGGTVTVLDQNEFSETVARITSDDTYFQELSIKQRESSTAWGNLDGKSAARFLDLINKSLKVKYEVI